MGFKQQAFEELATLAKALASAKRLELLDYIIQAPRSVEKLAEMANLQLANTSRHLQIMKQAGLVQVRQRGNMRFYSVAGQDVVQLLLLLHKTTRQHRGELDRLMQRFMEQDEPLDALDIMELETRLRNGDILLLDVRPVEEFENGHIPGALNMPLENLAETIGSLPRQREIVAYCRGPYCVYAHKAVEKLQQAGFRARRLALGMPEWVAAGKPVQQTSH